MNEQVQQPPDPNFLNHWLHQTPVSPLRRFRYQIDLNLSVIPTGIYVMHDILFGGSPFFSKVFRRFTFALPNNLALLIDATTQNLLNSIGLPMTVLNIVQYVPSDGTLKTLYFQPIRYKLNNVPLSRDNLPQYLGQRLYGKNLMIELWSNNGASAVNVTARFPDIIIPTSVLGNQDLRYANDTIYPFPTVAAEWSVAKDPSLHVFPLPFLAPQNNNAVVINTTI